MKHRYSDYTVEQLEVELQELIEKARAADEAGKHSHVAINERKIEIVQSYMLNPAAFIPDDVHELRRDPGHTFKISYINGVMAWGQRINLLGEMYEKVEALPIALLGEKVSS